VRPESENEFTFEIIPKPKEKNISGQHI